MSIFQKFSYFIAFSLFLIHLLNEEPPGASSDHGLTPRAHWPWWLGPSCRAGRKYYINDSGKSLGPSAQQCCWEALNTLPISHGAPAGVWGPAKLVHFTINFSARLRVPVGPRAGAVAFFEPSSYLPLHSLERGSAAPPFLEEIHSWKIGCRWNFWQLQSCSS